MSLNSLMEVYMEIIESIYKKYNNHKTKLLPCIGLADVIEDGNKEKQKEVLKKMLGQYRGKIKNVVLRLYTLSIDSARN